jgi:hypothetical protein
MTEILAKTSEMKTRKPNPPWRRLIDGVHINTTTGCWDWMKASKEEGYGTISVLNKTVSTHRLSYEVFVGPTNGNWVLHSCDNPRCINPFHLRIGNAKDNSRDRFLRGRHRTRCSALSNQGLLNPEKVREIRSKSASGINHKSLSLEYGVTRTAISQIVLRKTWRHV